MSSFEIPSLEEMSDLVVAHSCTRNCLGVAGNSAGCCTIGERDYIIGPIPDSKDFLERYKKTIDPEAVFDDIFISYKEGSKLYPDRPMWQNPDYYPALRIDEKNISLRCIFLNDDNLCTVHAIRSETCKAYSCAHVTEMLQKLSLELPND